MNRATHSADLNRMVVYHGQGNVAQNIWDGPDPPAPPPTIPFTPLPPLPPGLRRPVGSFIPLPIPCP